MFLKYAIIQELIRKNKTINHKKNRGFSLVELVVVIAVLSILSAVAIPSFTGIMEWAETVVAMYQLNNAHRQCYTNLSMDPTNRNTITYVIPNNTSRFQYPDSGDDGVCLSPETGNILTAARTAYGQAVSTFNLNINVLTGERSTERAVPDWVRWEN